uniref:Uncharacterized protein n=1 Tax=Triticum urartu TaxID=4572 RepID=A0A8R7ULL0_TRIUA
MEDSGLEFLLDAIDRFPLREEFADNLSTQIRLPLPCCRGTRRTWASQRTQMQILVVANSSAARAMADSVEMFVGGKMLLRQALPSQLT